MRSRMSAKLVEVVRLNGDRAGCHDRFSSRRPVGGEVFLLTAPFIEPTSGELRSINAPFWINASTLMWLLRISSRQPPDKGRPFILRLMGLNCPLQMAMPAAA